jgi:hypothetical protein
MKSITVLLTILLLNLTTCTEQQLSESRLAEIFYIDLVYNLHQDSIPAALEAESNLSLQLNNLRPLWQRPMSRRLIDNCRSHLNEAETAFAGIKPALIKGKKEAAIIQLDRAMNELSAADHDSFEKLYVGLMYDFYTTWRETNTIINDQMLCLLEWKEYVWWANLTRAEWDKIECTNPDPEIYKWTDEQLANFTTARTQLGEKLAVFTSNIDHGDQCVSQESANEVDESFWKFMLCLKAGYTSEPLLN